MFLLVHSEASSLRAAGTRRLMKPVAYYLKIRETSLSLQQNKIFIFHCIHLQNGIVITFQPLRRMTFEAKVKELLMSLWGRIKEKSFFSFAGRPWLKSYT